MDKKITRRDAIKGLTIAGIAITTAGLAGCAKTGANCEDLSKVSADELKKRERLGYLAKSADPRKKCSNCIQYTKPADANSCGTCKLFAGPVTPEGYCKTWVAIK